MRELEGHAGAVSYTRVKSTHNPLGLFNDKVPDNSRGAERDSPVWVLIILPSKYGIDFT